MINIKHLLKVSVIWTSLVYVVCFFGVALFPVSRGMMMRYAFHTNGNFGQNFIGPSTFISGLIIWNIIALLGFWSFAYLFNTIKK